jgi:hypothetical protein
MESLYLETGIGAVYAARFGIERSCLEKAVEEKTNIFDYFFCFIVPLGGLGEKPSPLGGSSLVFTITMLSTMKGWLTVDNNLITDNHFGYHPRQEREVFSPNHSTIGGALWLS